MSNNLLKKHAKSFYWASFFLSKEIFNKCSSLYNFCRTLDDIVDEDNKLEIKKNNFLQFKKQFMNKNLSNPIIKEMWSIINSEKISEKVVTDLFEGVETDLEEKVQINSKKELATLHGSGFSIQPKFSQSAYFRFHNQSEVFKNLYFVGAGTHPGAGMPGVLSSAKVLDKLFK